MIRPRRTLFFPPQTRTHFIAPPNSQWLASCSACCKFTQHEQEHCAAFVVPRGEQSEILCPSHVPLTPVSCDSHSLSRALLPPTRIKPNHQPRGRDFARCHPWRRGFLPAWSCSSVVMVVVVRKMQLLHGWFVNAKNVGIGHRGQLHTEGKIIHNPPCSDK